MIKMFIERPVLSTVISIIITILGVLGLMSLPVEQYPEIAPPTVQVSASYTGANAETVLNSVIIPLEEEINGVDTMVIRPKCYVSLSIDHRALDAHQTNLFLSEFVRQIENWGQSI